MNIIIDSNNESANTAIAEKLMESRNYVFCDLSKSALDKFSEFSIFDAMIHLIMTSYASAKKKKKNLLINGFIYSRFEQFNQIQVWYLESLFQPNNFIVIDTGLKAGQYALEHSGFDYIKYDPDHEFFIDLEHKLDYADKHIDKIDQIVDQELFGTCLFRNASLINKENVKIIEIMNFGTFQISYESFVQELFNLRQKMSPEELKQKMTNGEFIFVKKGNPIGLFIQVMLSKK